MFLATCTARCKVKHDAKRMKNTHSTLHEHDLNVLLQSQQHSISTPSGLAEVPKIEFTTIYVSHHDMPY